MQQLSLAISPREDATFASLLTIDSNAAVVRATRGMYAVAEYGLYFVHGREGCGRSHLLQALCHEALEAGEEAVFLPLAELRTHAPEDVFAGLENQRLVCLDDVELIAGLANWEEQLFNLINRKMLSGGSLVMAGALPPAAAGFLLPDLVSRLQQGLVLALREPSDEEKARLFIWRGYLRGMRVPVPVARFVLTHCSRDLRQLMALLDRIDAQSLKDKRRVTLPFVRELLQRRPSV